MASSRYLESFTAPKETLVELADIAEDEISESFASTLISRQIASRQSDYQDRRFERKSQDSVDAFEVVDNGQVGFGGYRDTMRMQRLEREEERLRRAIERKAGIDLDKTSLEVGEVGVQEGMRKRRWDALKMEEGVKDNEGESFQDVVVGSMPKKRRSRWDEPPSNVAMDVPGSKMSRWDQPPAGDGSPAPILMTMPGIKHQDEHNGYLTNEELDALLPIVGYIVVSPPAGYALCAKPHKLSPAPTGLGVNLPPDRPCLFKLRCG